VRELANVIERGVIISSGELFDIERALLEAPSSESTLAPSAAQAGTRVLSASEVEARRPRGRSPAIKVRRHVSARTRPRSIRACARSASGARRAREPAQSAAAGGRIAHRRFATMAR
jgi:hypothetical protein